METPSTSLRNHLRFHGQPELETVEGGRYTIRYQGIDDRKSVGEIKAEGDFHPWLFEVFDGGRQTYERRFSFRNDFDRKKYLEILRQEIASGIHASA